VDGSIKAQLGNPDMRLPIAVALAYPERLPGAVAGTNLDRLGSLDFHPLDPLRFASVGLARQAAAAGAPKPAVLNAANEEAVLAFLEGELSFKGIIGLVESALGAFSGGGSSLQEILDADRWAREYVRSNMGSLTR
jgi:1-deoxy-D-xylulose-5-phosphate reductoisomerase